MESTSFSHDRVRCNCSLRILKHSTPFKVFITKILNRKIASMKPTNVVSMDFTSAEAMEEFIKMYERDAPSLYSEAELLVLVKTEEASLIAIAAYPTEEDRLTASKTA